MTYVKLDSETILCAWERQYIFQYCWGCSVAADELGEVRIYQGSESRMTSYPVGTIKQVKGIVRILYWQHPSAVSVCGKPFFPPCSYTAAAAAVARNLLTVLCLSKP